VSAALRVHEVAFMTTRVRGSLPMTGLHQRRFASYRVAPRFIPNVAIASPMNLFVFSTLLNTNCITCFLALMIQVGA
jgi:hypothetical protein